MYLYCVIKEDVHAFVKKYGLELVSNSLQDAYKYGVDNFSKFKLTESQFSKFKMTAKNKIPEIKRAIELIEHIKKNNGIESSYSRKHN